MQNPLVDRTIELFLKARKDPVLFAQWFLNFPPFGYQKPYLRDQSPQIVACCGRQTGKTTLTAIKALHFALYNNSTHTLITSSCLRQAMILFNKIVDFVEICVPAQELLTHHSQTKIIFTNGSDITALPCGVDGSKIRGYTSDLVVVDEANYVRANIINSVIRPTMSTRPNAKIIMISTPYTKDHPFYEAFNNRKLGFSRYYFPTSINPLVTPKFLKQERRLIGEHDYNREYKAKFIDNQFAYFPSNIVLDCTADYELNNDPTPAQKYAGEFFVGIDFGKHQDHSAIAILQKISTTNTQLVYLNELPLGTEYVEVVALVRRLNDAYHFRGGNLDQTGPGESISELIEQFTPRIKGLTLTSQSKEKCLGDLLLAMEQHLVQLPCSNKTLLNQIISQQCKPSKSGKLIFSHPSGAHDDQLWALALALQSAQQADLQKPIFLTGRDFRLDPNS